MRSGAALLAGSLAVFGMARADVLVGADGSRLQGTLVATKSGRYVFDSTLLGRVEVATARFCLEDLEGALEREAEIWSTLVYEQRRVSREAYRALAEQTPPIQPRPTRYRFVAGEPPTRGPGARKVIGRRPSGSVNSLG